MPGYVSIKYYAEDVIIEHELRWFYIMGWVRSNWVRFRWVHFYRAAWNADAV